MSKDNSTPGQNDLGHINRVTQDMIDTRSSGLFKVTQFPKGTPRSAVAPWFTKCDGGPIARFMQDGTTKSYFFETYGVTYGAGDGSTTVQVPNYTESATLDNYIQTAPIGCDAAGNKVYGYYTQNELDKLGVSVYGKTYIDAKDKALEDYMKDNFRFSNISAYCHRIHNNGEVINGEWYKTGFFPASRFASASVGTVDISCATHTTYNNSMYTRLRVVGIIVSDGEVNPSDIQVIDECSGSTVNIEVEVSIIAGEICVRNTSTGIMTVDVVGYSYYNDTSELVDDYSSVGNLEIKQTEQIEMLSKTEILEGLDSRLTIKRRGIFVSIWITGSTSVTNETIDTLPIGWRPLVPHRITGYSSPTIGALLISTSGLVRFGGPSGALANIDCGYTFVCDRIV